MDAQTLAALDSYVPRELRAPTHAARDRLPGSLTDEIGRTFPLAKVTTLDEIDQRAYGSRIVVDSLYTNVNGNPFYRFGEGRREDRHNPVRDVAMRSSTIHEARAFGVNLDSLADVQGSFIARNPASLQNGLSLADVTRLDPRHRQWRRSVPFDAAPNLFLYRELQRVLPELVEIELRRSDTARAIFPIENLGQVGISSFSWQQIDDRSPEAEWADPGSDRPVPGVRFTRTEQARPIRPMRHGFTLNWFMMEQLAAARANGQPDLRIEARSLEESRLQCLRLENRTIVFGAPSQGILGLLTQNVGVADPVDVDPNNPLNNAQGIPQVGTPVAGTWLSEVFPGAAGTGEEMYNIITQTFTATAEETDEVERPDTIVLGTQDYININRTIYHGVNADSTESVAQVILRNMRPLGLRAIQWLPELGFRTVLRDRLLAKDDRFAAVNDRGIGGQTFASTYAGGLAERNCMLIYKRDARKSAIVVGHDLLVRPPVMAGADNEQTTVWLFSGGFLVKKPRSMRIVVAPAPP